MKCRHKTIDPFPWMTPKVEAYTFLCENKTESEEGGEKFQTFFNCNSLLHKTAE